MTLLLLLQAPMPSAVQLQEGATFEVSGDRSDALNRISGAIASGHVEEAATLIQLFEARHPHDAGDEFTLLKGELALDQGLILDAERLVAPINASSELRCRVEGIRALAMAERPSEDAAIDKLGAVAETCDPDWRIWSTLGRLLAKRGEEEASRYAFINAQAVVGASGRVHTDFARALIVFGDPVAAADELQRAMSIDPQDQDAKRLQDFVTGMRGFQPQRITTDTDESWARRLADAAQGARQGDRTALAKALFAEALLIAPRFDPRLMAEASRP